MGNITKKVKNSTRQRGRSRNEKEGKDQEPNICECKKTVVDTALISVVVALVASAESLFIPSNVMRSVLRSGGSQSRAGKRQVLGLGGIPNVGRRSSDNPQMS